MLRLLACLFLATTYAYQRDPTTQIPTVKLTPTPGVEWWRNALVVQF